MGFFKKCATSYCNLRKIKKENENLKHQIGSLQNSVSFKVGRIITWVPRKIRGGVKCLSQHGVGYTIKRMVLIGEDDITITFSKKNINN